MAENNTFLPGIIVINSSYLPQNGDAPALVGDSSFTNSAINVLHETNVLQGLVLYARDENISNPHIIAHDRVLSSSKSVQCLSVFFNFRMPKTTLTNALQTAFSQIASRLGGPLPVVYYQTDTLLDYHPTRFPFAVTHHDPFVADFCRHFSAAEAAMAFGNAEKANLLRHQQNLGVQTITQSTNGFVLLHSALQQRYLLEAGVPTDKCCLQLAPPIRTPNENRLDDEYVLPESIEQFLQIHQCRLLLFTAVARLDHFKNVPVLIEAALTLLERGVDLHVLVAGDSREDSSRRQALVSMIPPRLRFRFLILPRLPKPILYGLFERCKKDAVFVCPSRYETLGITPLEAVLGGMVTLVPDSPLVEASNLFPTQYRVKVNHVAIAERIMDMVLEGTIEWHGGVLKKWVEKRAGEEKFKESLVKAWAKLSDDVRRISLVSEDSPLVSDNSDSD